MSFDSSGLPEAVCAPETTQLLEPGRTGWSLLGRTLTLSNLERDHRDRLMIACMWVHSELKGKCWAAGNRLRLLRVKLTEKCVRQVVTP